MSCVKSSSGRARQRRRTRYDTAPEVPRSRVESTLQTHLSTAPRRSDQLRSLIFRLQSKTLIISLNKRSLYTDPRHPSNLKRHNKPSIPVKKHLNQVNMINKLMCVIVLGLALQCASILDRPKIKNEGAIVQDADKTFAPQRSLLDNCTKKADCTGTAECEDIGTWDYPYFDCVYPK